MHRCKTELDQLLKGLGVLELVRANTKMMREIFLGTVIMKNVTADLLFDGSLLCYRVKQEGARRKNCHVLG